MELGELKTFVTVVAEDSVSRKAPIALRMSR
jgi:hypothetical protein